MRTVRKVGGLVAAILLVGVLSAAASVAAEPTDIPETPETPTIDDIPEPATLAVGTVVESWYQLTSVNTCGSPAGCVPASAEKLLKVPAVNGVSVPGVSPYPADTLHVGFAGAVETARTYLKLDLTSLPDGAQVFEGQLTLPVDTRPTSGTLQPEQAQMKACLTTSGFHNQAGGSLVGAPKISCGVSSPLSYSGGKFTVDLAPFMEAWADGEENFGIAITPFKVPDPTKPFHVAFPSSSATKLPHIGGLLSYELASAVEGEEVLDDVVADTGAGFEWVGPTTKKAAAARKTATSNVAAGTGALTRTAATPVAPPSDWTVPILAGLAGLAGMGGVYELTRVRMRRYAF